MLTFRHTNVFFGTAVACLLIMHVFSPIPWYIFCGLIVVYLLFVAYGSYSISGNFFMKVLCSAQTDKKQIAISFDDGPVEGYTPRVLEVLKEQNVPAAFFCIGWRIVENELLFRKVYEEGHVIGNHSYSHNPSFDMLPSKKMLQDLQKTDDAVNRVLGLRTKMFRPPYGVTTPAMKKAVEQGGYTAIGWNIRSLDKMAKNEEKLLRKLTRLLRPGAVILFHDTQKITLAILPRFIQAARNEGYEFVRLDNLLNIDSYA